MFEKVELVNVLVLTVKTLLVTEQDTDDAEPPAGFKVQVAAPSKVKPDGIVMAKVPSIEDIRINKLNHTNYMFLEQ